MPFEVDRDFHDFVYIKVWNTQHLSIFHVWALVVPALEQVEKLLEELADYGDPDDDGLALLHAVWPDQEREIARLVLERAFLEGGGR